MKQSLREYLNESILDPVHEKLSSDLWINDKVKPSAKAHIMKKFETWLKGCADIKVKDALLLGSMTGYQYTNTSDIDINVVIPVSNEKLKELGKILPNGHNLPGTEHPVYYFLSNKVNPDWKKAGSIYNLLKDKWIKKPEKGKPESIVSNYRATIEIARFFIAGLLSVITEYETDVDAYKTYEIAVEDVPEEQKDEIQQLMNFKSQEIIADIDGITIAYYMLRSLRKEAFAEDKGPFETITKIDIKNANTSINNLIYKYIERLGFFDKINKIKDEKEKWERLLR